MKFSIERAALLRTLGHAQSVVERRNTIPVLSNVLLDASDGKLVISATDLDIQTRESADAEIDQPGRTTVSAHTFFDIARKMPEDGRITVAVSDGRMLLTGGRARFTLPVLPAEDFPDIKVGELPTEFALPAETFSNMIGKTRFAMSTEETRYYLNGIFLHIGQGPDGEPILRAASTDGHRLALATQALPDGLSAMPAVIIPRKCVSEIAKVIDTVDGDIRISLSSTKIRFEMGDLVYVSKVIDGTFPDYERVIPRANPRIVTVSADGLSECIDRVATIATERTRAVKVAISSGRMTLSVTSPEHGVAVEEIEADYADGDLEIGFNARYFLDILNLHRGQDIEIALNDSAAPTLIRKSGERADLSVLMPMRV